MRPFRLDNSFGQQLAIADAAASQSDTAAACGGFKRKDERRVSHGSGSGCAQQTGNIVVKDKNHQRAEQGYADLLRPNHG